MPLCLSDLHRGTGCKNCRACFLAVGINPVLHRDGELLLVLFQQRLCHCKVSFQTCYALFRCRDFCRIPPCNIRFQAVNLAGVVGPHQLQLADLNIQIHLFLDVGISRCQCFDFCIGQRGIVHIIAGTNRRFRGHDLRDELLFIFQNLPHIRIERILCDVTENLHFLVAVSLTKNASFLLFQIRGLPRAVQMMQGDQSVLNVCTSTKFRGRTKQDTHLTGAHLCKQFCLFGFGICLMDKSNLLTGDSLCHQFFPDIIVHIECSVCFRGR